MYISLSSTETIFVKDIYRIKKKKKKVKSLWKPKAKSISKLIHKVLLAKYTKQQQIKHFFIAVSIKLNFTIHCLLFITK